jgi:hypothetical protein
MVVAFAVKVINVSLSCVLVRCVNLAAIASVIVPLIDYSSVLVCLYEMAIA